jgi:glutaredoxin-related protein
MKITVYGTTVCPKTIHDLNVLWDKGCTVNFINITGSIGLLREFINMRDEDPVFSSIKAEGRLGTPFFVLDDGTRTHDLNIVLKKL